MAAKTSDWRPGPTVCRCCLAEGCYKDISTEYFWMGKREVYAEMLAETFDLSIAYSQSGGPNSNSRLICEPCISRLRDAADFKRQVVECEKMFLQHLDPSSSSLSAIEITAEEVEEEKELKIEQVKEEKLGSDEDFDDGPHFGDDDDDDLDDQPLTKLASKLPKKESVDLLDLIDNAKVAEKRKSTVKVKATPIKKVKLKKETKASASKAKPEKKKKGQEETAPDASVKEKFDIKWKKIRRVAEDKANAGIILQNSNAVAFRWHRGRFMCAYCPLICPSVTEIRQHSNEHANKQDIFLNSGVRNSFPLRVDITDLTCMLCFDRIENLENLKVHLSNKHFKLLNPDYSDGLVPFVLTGKDYKCVNCSALFESFMGLYIHMNEHYQTYVCYTCGKGYSSKHKLMAHQKSHESGQFECTKCDNVFSNRLAKYRHMSSAHGPKERYRCPVCGDHFDSYHSRLRHLDKVHGQKIEYRCSVCPSVFGTGTLRNSHMRVV
ncbi:unnamed protein product, partial [Parnassius mnemosyne]